MISANEAARLSICNSTVKVYLENLENSIKNSINEGEREAIIYHDIEEAPPSFVDNVKSSELKDAIVKTLKEFGYKTEFKYSEPIPSGCRSDQWNFNNGYIKVKW